MPGLTDKSVEKGSFTVYFVEFLGAFALTFCSCWALIARDIDSGFHLSHALSAGLIVFVFLWLGSSDKLPSLNPALTLTMLAMKKQEWSEGIIYIILQFAGAIVAAGFVFIELGDDQSKLIAHGSILGIPTPGSSSYDSSVLMGEILAGLFLGYIYSAATAIRAEGKAAGKSAAVVGAAVFMLLLTMSESFGAGLNPARSLAPALMSGRIGSAQLGHFLGPVVGCLLGGVVQASIFSEDDEEDVAEKPAAAERENLNKQPGFDREIELQERQENE